MGVSHWHTRNGRLIAIADMTDDHLINTVLYLRRNAELVRESDLLDFLFGPQPHGLHAMEAWDRECQELESIPALEYLEKHHDSYKALVGEVEKRNLQERITQ